MVLSWVTYGATFFIAWWLCLFIVMPIGLKTQDEAGEVMPGTDPSAPAGRHVPRAMLRATLLAALLVGAFYYAVEIKGFGFDDIPRIAPERISALQATDHAA